MRRALVIGIDDYTTCPLKGCINDAIKVQSIIERNGDGSPNFCVKPLLSSEQEISRALLRQEIDALFSGNPDIALLYFSGHGFINSYGGYIVSQDFKNYDEGVSMDDILNLANKSQAKSRIIILDCCYSGNMGSPAISESKYTELADGVTVLTSCKKNEESMEVNGQGVFTSLLVEALYGGCSDLIGHITPGSIYAYIDRALGPWDQRPMFKTNVSTFVTLRDVDPPIDPAVLRNLIVYFKSPYDEYNLDPSYEYTEKVAKDDNVKIMKELQQMERVGLVIPVGENHMYYAAIKSKSCKLTAVGVQYWKLVSTGYI